MNKRSLEIIEESMEFNPMWTSLEIANDSIYLDFTGIELGNPKDTKDFSIRFANNAFICFFYNDIWSLDFLADYDFSNENFDGEFSFKIDKFKFQSFDNLDELFGKYEKEKTFLNKDFDIRNIRSDFFLTFQLEDIAICVCGNEMNFFFGDEKVDSDLIKILSNQWILYYLNYCKKRIKRDEVCKRLFEVDVK